jgi:hypothetical protein
MTLNQDRRSQALSLLEQHGLEIKQPVIDRDGGSYAIGRKGENTYDSPTFASADDVLEWVVDSPEAVERISKGEAFLVSFWLIERMEAAAAETSGTEAFLEAIMPDLTKASIEADRQDSDDLIGIIDDIRDMDDKESQEIIAWAREALGVPDFSTNHGLGA